MSLLVKQQVCFSLKIKPIVNIVEVLTFPNFSELGKFQ